jgi:FkbM family methyltransferase
LLKETFRYFVLLFKSLGTSQAFYYILQRLRCRLINSQHPYWLRSQDAKYPLLCRPNSSDIEVFNQIFVQREYSCVDSLSNVDLVIDCGANVGYSSSYFLNRFPNCYLIAIEPSPANFYMLEKNLIYYRDRIQILQTAIWSHPANLVISENIYRDGREWSYQVRECNNKETPALRAVDIPTLINASKRERISILKMDIEGAEAVVFSANIESWIDHVDTMLIELHDDSQYGKSSEIVYEACKNSYSLSHFGELTVCTSLA